jgi:hypothetical protein
VSDNGAPPDSGPGGPLGIPDAVAQAARNVVVAALDRVISSDLVVTSAAQGKRMLAEDDDAEELADTVQRLVGLATPLVRVALRGARLSRVPWLLVASSTVSLTVTVRAGVRELRVLAAFLQHRFELELGQAPDPALLQKLTLELYLSPKRTPDASDLDLPLARLVRRWVVSGALGRDTRSSTGKALDRAERLDLTAFAHPGVSER